jgi:hypothetical protein
MIQPQGVLEVDSLAGATGAGAGAVVVTAVVTVSVGVVRVIVLVPVSLVLSAPPPPPPQAPSAKPVTATSVRADTTRASFLCASRRAAPPTARSVISTGGKRTIRIG